MDYGAIVKKIEQIPGSEVIGEIGPISERFPFYSIKCGMGKRKVLLLSSTHGDEPAGTHAIIHFFEKELTLYENDFSFQAFPCVNPWGFEHFSRSNHLGLNLNREFKAGSVAEEIRLILSRLERYVVAVDLHETMKKWIPIGKVGRDEPEGKTPEEFFLWEWCEDKNVRIGKKIVSNVEAMGYPVCKWPMIFKDRNNDGVIWYPENCGTPCYANNTMSDNVSSDAYLIMWGHTKHAFTIETMRDWPLVDRVAIDTKVLKTILDANVSRS